MTSLTNLAQTDRKDRLRFVFPWRRFWRHLKRKSLLNVLGEFASNFKFFSLLRAEDPIILPENTYNAVRNVSAQQFFITSTTKPRGWHLSPQIVGVYHENGSSCSDALCLPLRECSVWAFSELDHSPLFETFTLHCLHLTKFLGCLGCPAPESALTFLWKSRFSGHESCKAAKQWQDCYYPFFDTSGTWNNKDDYLPTQTQKAISQTTVKPACIRKQIFFPLLIPLCHQVWQQHLSRGCSSVDHEVSTTACSLTHSMECRGKGTEKLALIRNIFCLKAKFRQILPNEAFLLPKLMLEREATHSADSSSQLPAALIY